MERLAARSLWLIAVSVSVAALCGCDRAPQKPKAVQMVKLLPDAPPPPPPKVEEKKPEPKEEKPAVPAAQVDTPKQTLLFDDEPR